jgi:hypothetical protein
MVNECLFDFFFFSTVCVFPEGEKPRNFTETLKNILQIRCRLGRGQNDLQFLENVFAKFL